MEERNGYGRMFVNSAISLLPFKVKIVCVFIIIFVVLFASFAYMLDIDNRSKEKNNNKKRTTTVSEMSYLGGSIFPLPVQDNSLRVTGVFGYRICPFHGEELHGGLDLVGADGSNIICVYPGEVVVSMYSNSYGNTVVVKHNLDINSDGNAETVYTRYAHMKYTPFVSVGDNISQGTLLGFQGSTGNSTGSHLHFELSIDNYYSNKIDPAPYLGLANITKGSTITAESQTNQENN